MILSLLVIGIKVQHVSQSTLQVNSSTPRVSYGDIEVILTSGSLWMKSYSVTIQMKPCQQYFHMVLFII